MTQLATTGSTAVSTDVMNLGSFGTENVISSDLRVPKILLMQAMSDFVQEGKAAIGDIVDSFEGKKLGDLKSTVQIIPFYMTNTWTIKKEVSGKMVFDRVDPREGTDVRREYEVIGADGIKRTNHRTMNIFCLVKNGNLNVPYLISLMNSSFSNAAQPYLNKVQLLKAEGKSPAHICWMLGVAKEENDKGKWVSFTLEAAKDDSGKDIMNTTDEVMAAYTQYKTLSSAFAAGVKVDMSDIPAEQVIETVSTNKAKF